MTVGAHTFCGCLSRAQGAPTVEHAFWEYPRGKPLCNPRWDTYDATVLCSNCVLSPHQTSDVGLVRWVCNGHPAKLESLLGGIGTSPATATEHVVRCEDCELMTASHGLVAEGWCRWCSDCGLNHEGAIVVKTAEMLYGDRAGGGAAGGAGVKTAESRHPDAEPPNDDDRPKRKNTPKSGGKSGGKKPKYGAHGKRLGWT